MKNFQILLIAIGMLIVSSTISLAQTYTPGILTFKFTPVSHNGSWGSKHVMAVWIQTDSNDFVKTRLRYVGGGTDDHLPIWGANAGCSNPYSVTSSSCNTTDAITGATLSSYSARTVTWDGKNVSGSSNGTTVADGIYKVTIEECWNHGSTGRTDISYTFTKGPNAQHQEIPNSTHFTDITLDWVPSVMPLTATITTSNDSFGNCNGSATVVPSGGQSPYTYLWSTNPAQSTPSATGLCAGSYSVTITDSASTTFVANATVSATGTALSATASSTNAMYGNCNGTATANPTGGLTPYTYKWSTSPVQNTKTASALCAGNYTVTVSDSYSNLVITSVTVNATGTALTSTTNTTNAMYGNCNGTATANPAGGLTPYTYKWSTSPVQTTKTASGLCAGNYTVTVSDAYSNTVVASATVNATGTALTTNVSSTNASAGTCNGTATAIATGGLSPYTYSWSTSPVQTAVTATGLCPGNYTVTVTDAASNSDTATVTIISTVGITELNADKNVSIYPNPSDGTFSLRFDEATSIKIENALGEIVFEENISKGVNEIKNIDLSDLPSGTYTISVINGERLSKHQVVLNK